MSAFQRIWYTLYWWLWSLFQPKSVRRDFEAFKRAHNTPFLIQAYMWANIKYRKDTKPWHHWQPAMKTWEIGQGDCEDFAILACECLRKKYQCYYLCMYTTDSGHATLLISRSGGWKSVGTFGLQNHKGDPPGIVKDWKNYKNWTMVVMQDEDQSPLEVWYR